MHRVVAAAVVVVLVVLLLPRMAPAEGRVKAVGYAEYIHNSVA